MPQGLLAYGWNANLEAQLERCRIEGSEPARVIVAERDAWTVVMDKEGRPVEAKAILGGRMAHSSRHGGPSVPVTGDWVLIEESAKDLYSITAVLPRFSRFSRKMKGETEHDKVAEQVLVANVDTAVLVCAAGYDWNPRRIERYLALVADSGAEAILLVSKADLADQVERLIEEGRSLAPGIPVLAVSSKTGSGIDTLSHLLAPGKTAALLGSSGSGKSSLLNALSGRNLERVHEVRADDHRGRHTTSRRSLYRLPSGPLVIDTPGLREVQLWVDSEDIDAVFPEIEALSTRCRFRDCAHITEPGCAVLAAVERGEIEAERLAAWRRLRDELDTLRARRLLVQKWARIKEAVRSRQESRYGVQARGASASKGQTREAL